MVLSRFDGQNDCLSVTWIRSSFPAEATFSSLEAAVVELPQVRHAERLFGDPDYLLRVVARDLASFATPRSHRFAACLEPCLAIGEVFLSWAPVEDLFESGDDPAGIGLGAAVAAGHEDHAEVASPAGCYCLMVQRAEVAKVIGDDGAVLSTGERQHLRI